MLKDNPFLDRTHTLSRKGMWSRLPSLAKELRAQDYDIALDLQGLFKSALIAKLSGAKRIVGPAEAREGATLFYSQKVARDISRTHVIRGYLNLAEAIGGLCEPEPPMRMPTEPGAPELPSGRPLVILNPSAGKARKQWPPERLGEVGRRLGELGAVPVVTGAPADRELASAVLDRIPGEKVDLTGKTNLLQLADVLSRSNLFIGGDTGPMHIAQAVGCRVLALFGPTDPRILGPRDPRDRVIWHGPAKRDDSVPHPLMLAVSVDEVFEAALAMLKESGAQLR